MSQRDTIAAASSSGGVSGDESFYLFATAGQEDDITKASAILDLGCGQGYFGEFINRRFNQLLDGIDIINYSTFHSQYYKNFTLVNLEKLGEFNLINKYDMIFVIGIVEYLENPRLFIRSASNFLAPHGKLIIIAPNPISLSSLGSLVVRGQFNAFTEKSSPGSITPVLPVDAVRMIKEAQLNVVSLDYSNKSRLPLTQSWSYQKVFPFLKGRFFSDHYRVIAKLST
jgi:2-polyprenyl-3-methyl-5-hydroxy-6-metoxy-1,4-benzoquinol methylase